MKQISEFRPKFTVLLMSISVILTIPFLLTGCDNTFSQDGKVYEWRDAPTEAVGEIYVDMDVPAGRTLKPLSDVTVSFEYITTVQTDETGAFHAGGVTGPVPELSKFTVSKQGYKTVTGEYQYNRSPPTITILLVHDR
jgi:hypothetical protein